MTIILWKVDLSFWLLFSRYGKWRKPLRFRFPGKEANQHFRYDAFNRVSGSQNKQTCYKHSNCEIRNIFLRGDPLTVCVFRFPHFLYSTENLMSQSGEQRSTIRWWALFHLKNRLFVPSNYYWRRQSVLLLLVNHVFSSFLCRPWSTCHTSCIHCASEGLCMP